MFNYKGWRGIQMLSAIRINRQKNEYEFFKLKIKF